MNGRLEEILSRIATAVEKMASDPEIEIEGGPPICANCGRMNPTVEIGAQEAVRGPLIEMAVECLCTHCGSSLWVIPESYSVHKSAETAAQELAARAASMKFDLTQLEGRQDENL